MLTVQQSPTDPDFVQDPYPFYTRLREAGDLVWWDEYDMPCATTFRAVHSLLRDRRFGREIPAEMATPLPDHLAPFYAVEAHSMLELEPPRHTRLRSLVLRAFTSRRIKELGPEITQLAHAQIDAFPSGQPFDVLSTFCQPIPVIVIARLLGVPDHMAPSLLTWSNTMVAMYQANRTYETECRAADAAKAFSEFLTAYINTRRKDPRDDLITHLIAAEESGEKLSTNELITTCILLLNAGHEATVHTLGNGIKLLLEQNHAVVPDKPDLTCEEILRFDPPLHMFSRYAYEDITAFGHTFRRGDQVALLLASANRDETHWEKADIFEPTRHITQNASFGGGLHFCVGAPLARLELQIALPILFKRCPTLRLASKPRYANMYHFHGLDSLMVATN